MHSKVFALVVSIMLLSLALPAAAFAEKPAADEINFEDYVLDLVDYTLPNGLRVILAKDHSAPVVAVDIWYHVGGANDPPGRGCLAQQV